MEKFDAVFKQLRNSISVHKIDFELLQTLNKALNDINISAGNFDQFANFLYQVYELSNNDKLYTIKRTAICIGQMAIELKLLVCKMMTMMMKFLEKQQSANEVPLKILSQSIQIMVICTRVCLNEGTNRYISMIQDFYKYIHSPYQYVSGVLTKNIRFLHQINVLQIMRYRCQNEAFSVMQFKKRLSQAASYQQYLQPDYNKFIQNIIMEILLKSIKNGRLKPEEIKQFVEYLSEDKKKDLNYLVFGSNHPTKNLETGSEFLQIYKQIKEQGIGSVNIEFLQQFIKDQQNFNDDRLFEIAALTLEPKILDIWFTVLNSKKQKTPLIQKAFMCFIHIAESILHQKQPPNKQSVQNILKLSNSIAFAMLTQKKGLSSNQPFLQIIKVLVKVLTWICFSLYQNWQHIKDFGQRIVLLCSRYQSMEISKVIYSVMFYYCLVKKIKAEDIYQRFVAHHSNQKQTQIFKLLASAYQLQKSGSLKLENQKMQESLKKVASSQPFVAILFAQNNQDLTILQLEINDFKVVERKLYIYSELLKKYQNQEKNVLKILDHLQEFLIKTSIEQFQTYMLKSEEQNAAVQEIFLVLIEMLEKISCKGFQSQKMNVNLADEKFAFNNTKLEQNIVSMEQSQLKSRISCQISFILINFYILGHQKVAQQFKEVGVLLNKYSIKVKMITTIMELMKKQQFHLNIEIYNVICTYLISVLQKFKKLCIKNQRIGQPGEVSFVHAIMQLMEVYHQIQVQNIQHQQIDIDKDSADIAKQKYSPESSEVKKNFIIFTIFEIDCLTNNHQKYLKLIEKLPIPLIKTFSQSVYSPKNLKQKILRRIVRQDFMEAKCDITLKQFKQIIQLTQDPQEVQLYIKYVASTFGGQGRKMLMLMANENKRIQKILLNEVDI